MKKINIKLFSGHFWQRKLMRKFGSATFYLFPSIRFIDDRMPAAIDGVKGVVLLLVLTCEAHQQHGHGEEQPFKNNSETVMDNTDAGNLETIVFHEEEC